MIFTAPLALLALLFLIALVIVNPEAPIGLGADAGSDMRAVTYAGVLR